MFFTPGVVVVVVELINELVVISFFLSDNDETSILSLLFSCSFQALGKLVRAFLMEGVGFGVVGDRVGFSDVKFDGVDEGA